MRACLFGGCLGGVWGVREFGGEMGDKIYQ
jgi:hypothetical protein